MSRKKKIFMLATFAILLFINICVFAGDIYKINVLLGDADKNNIVNKDDAQLILEKLANIKEGKENDIILPITADTNLDNKIDLLDVVDIMRYTKANEGEIDNNTWIEKLQQEVEFGIREDEITIDLSENISKKITITGNNYGNITYKIEDSDVVSIDNNGNISGNSNGETYIVATEDKWGLSSRCKLIVQTSPTGIELNKSSVTLDLSGQKKVTLKETMKPTTANIETEITWTSSDERVATVQEGVVTAKSNGNCKITARTANGKKIDCNITVKTSTTSISLSQEEVYLDLSNNSENLIATQYPSTVSSKGIEWKSSDTDVVTVEDGKITRVGTGTAQITAKATDGSNISATCNVTVKKEKLIICGPSTVARLAGTAKVTSQNGDLWGIDYYDEFGYTVKATSAQIQSGGAYENITNSTDNETADLFFICESGRGLRYFANTNFNGQSVSQLNSNNVECFESTHNGVGGESLEELLNNGNNDWHFTVAFVCSGNDLTKGDMTAEMVDNIAQLNADYIEYLAEKYPEHNFHVFPITPVDESNVTNENYLVHSYDIAGSNNEKRYRFACTLNKAVNEKTQTNIKYANGFFLDLVENSKYVGTLGGRTCTGDKIYTKLNGKNSTTAAYTAYDGIHYTRWGCRIVMEQVLIRCGVVDDGGIKLK